MDDLITTTNIWIVEYLNLPERLCIRVELSGRRCKVFSSDEDLSFRQNQEHVEGNVVENEDQGTEIHVTPESSQGSHVSSVNQP